MKEYFLQADVDSEAPWDVPSIESEPQQFVNEDEINEGFEPANDAFQGLRDLGDWVIEFFTDFFSGIFGTIM